MFNPERLSLIVQPVGDGGIRFFGYQTDDVEATVTGAGYATNAADYGLRTYDLIFVSPLSGAVDTYILAVDTIDADGHATLASPGPIGDMLKSIYDPTNVAGDAFAMDNMVEGAVTKILTAAERAAIAALGTAANADLLDEDDMASNSATDVPSQQSVKAYVDHRLHDRSSRADAIANFHPITAPDFIRTAGYAAAGDGGGALYKKVVAEPSHAGKLSITLAGATTAWYELAETAVNPAMFSGVSYATAALASAGTDSAAAVQSALNTGIPVIVPLGTFYRCSSAVAVTNVNVHVEGAGGFVFTNASGGGVTISQNDTYETKWGDVSILTNQELAGSGLKISYTSTIVENQRHQRLCSIGSPEIGGIDSVTGAWTIGLDLVDVNGVDGGHILIRGRRNLGAAAGTADREWLAGTTGASITVTNNSSPVSMDLPYLRTRHVETGVVATGEMEGLNLSNSIIINCRDGLAVNWDASGTSGDATNPGLFLDKAHVNATETALYLKGVTEISMQGLEIYRFPNVDSLNFIGIEADTVSEASIMGCKINGTNTTGTPGTVTAMKLTNFKRSIVSFNNMYLVDANIVVENAGSVDNSFANNFVRSGTGASVVFQNGADATDNYVGFAGGVSRTAKSGAVTVLSSTTTVVSISLSDAVKVGEKYRVTGYFSSTKGATAGLSRFILTQTGGTGSGVWQHDLTSVINRPGANQAASTLWEGSVQGVFTVTTGGTLQVTLQGVSAGSDSTVADGAAQIVVERVC